MNKAVQILVRLGHTCHFVGQSVQLRLERGLDVDRNLVILLYRIYICVCVCVAQNVCIPRQPVGSVEPHTVRVDNDHRRTVGLGLSNQTLGKQLTFCTIVPITFQLL